MYGLTKLNDVGNQKHQEEKEEEAIKQAQSNVKQKNLVTLKKQKVAKNLQDYVDEPSFSDDDDE
jgi:hypothetical protein